MGPRTVTGAPAASVSFASIKARWLFQSMKYGPTRAAVRTMISKMARTVMLSRTEGQSGSRGAVDRHRQLYI